MFTADTAGAGTVTFGGTNASIMTTGGTSTAGANAGHFCQQGLHAARYRGVRKPPSPWMALSTDAASMKALIDAQLGSSGVTTAVSGGQIMFTASTAGVGNVTIGGANASLFTTGGLATAGTAADDKRAGFTIDGHVVALTTDLTDQAGLIAELQTQVGANYTVAASGTNGFQHHH